MKGKEQGQDLQICYLTQDETDDPSPVLRDFTDDLSLEAVRKLIVTMRNVCSTTDNVTFGDPKAREDLFYVTDRMIRFFEASYIQQKRANFLIQMDGAQIRHLKVVEKRVLRNIPGVPNTVPSLYLYGQWLALAEFLPGNDVTIVAERRKMFITPSSDWEAVTNSVKMRA